MSIEEFVSTTGQEIDKETLRELFDVIQLRAARDDDAKRVGPLRISFDARSEDAVDWADRHAAELIDGITETTRENINNAIAEALESGDLSEAYDTILEAVGSEARAKMISRTEIMTAANEGQRQGWDQAVEAGLLPEDARRTWIATGDSGVCPVCEGLDGEVTTLDGEYPDPGGNGPPAHISCRCTEGIA